MRSINASRASRAFVVLAGFVLLLFDGSMIQAAVPEQTISGTLLSEHGEVSCDHCVISLLANGVRPVATTYLDLGGHFAFKAVPQGSYTIHAEIDGFEDVNQPVDVQSFGLETNLAITLVRKPAVSRTRDGDIVNVSEFTEGYPKKAVEAFKKGVEYRKQKKDEQAIKSFETAIHVAPGFYQAHNELGVVYKQVGRTDDAENEFLRAHELNHTNVEPLLNLSTLYLDENKPERAVNASEEAVRTNSRSAPAFFNLGMALYKAAMLDRAEAALKRALELAPKMAAVRLMLANVYLKLHRYDSLLEQLNTYIAENPHGEQLQAVTQMRDQLLKAKEAAAP
jgi:tetratricopeptide (TPR) repeat protein